MSAAETRRLGAGLAEALRDVHRAGVVHRDLRPGNVLLAEDGPRLIDSGITAEDGVDAAAGFVAPELVAGGEATAAADVYSLGAVLTFAATGHGPFGAGSPSEVLLRQASGDRDISAVPEGLRDVVARCLDILPGGRPTTDALLELLGGDATSDQTVKTPKTSPKTFPKASPKDSPAHKNPKAATKYSRQQPAPVPTRRKVLYAGIAGAAVAAFSLGVAKMPHGDGKTTGAERPGGGTDDSNSDSAAVLPTYQQAGILGGPLRNPAWSKTVSGGVDLVALSGDTLLARGVGLTAFDKASGAQRWSVGSGVYSEFDDGALPVIGDTVYEAAYGAGDIVAVGVASGKEAWRVPPPADWIPRDLVGASADIAVGWSFVDSGASSDSTAQGLWAVDTHLRQQLWNIPIPAIDGAPYYSAGTDQVVLSQPGSYQLTAYDAKTGKQAWSAVDTTSHIGETIAFATAIANHGTTVYWATNRLYALDELGRRLWPSGVFEGDGSLFHAVVADDDTVYAAWDVPAGDSAIAAYRASDGAPRWKAAWPHDVSFMSSSLECQMVLAAGRLFVADRTSATLIVLDAATGETRWQFHDPAAAHGDNWHLAADDHYVCICYGTTVRGFTVA